MMPKEQSFRCGARLEKRLRLAECYADFGGSQWTRERPLTEVHQT